MTKLCDFKRDNLTVLMWLKYLLIGRRQEDVTNCATKFFYNKALLLYFQCHNFFTYFFFYIFMYCNNTVLPVMANKLHHIQGGPKKRGHPVIYCQASFEIVTRIRHMAPLLYIINFRKLRLRVKNETTFISAKNRVDLSSISEVKTI